MTRSVLRSLCAALSLAVAASVAPAVAATSLYGVEPVAGTPHVLDVDGDGPDGVVNAIVAVGNQIVLGGNFSEARNDGGSDVDRSDLLSFDRTSKQLTPLSLPFDGEVFTLLPAGGTKVYVGGQFDLTSGGEFRKHLVLVDLAANGGAGGIVDTFDATLNGTTLNGKVKDLAFDKAGRLWAAGSFQVQGAQRAGLVTLHPTTGQRDTYSNVFAGGTHVGGGTTGVKKIAITRDGKRLFAIGNFTTMGGVARSQFAVLDLGSTKATLAPYATSFYQKACPAQMFEVDSYMRDLDLSPDGKYIVVVTGGGRGDEYESCDSAARFETGVSGANVRPSWISLTGGDTFTAVEVDDRAVYVGGHFQYLNNPHSAINQLGETLPGPGATARTALAALDPANGLPLDWDPTRDRGKGVFDFLRTADGLWVGSDTEHIGPSQATRRRIALLPAGGLPVAVQAARTLPGNVYQTGAYGQVRNPRFLYRVDAAGAGAAPANGIGWAQDTGASPSPHRVRGPKVKKRKAVTFRAPNVPAETPAVVYKTSRLGTKRKPDQSWNFPVQKGQKLVVRLYFAKPCKCKGVGTWSQRVEIEGKRRTKRLNLAKAAGNKKAIMRSYAVRPKNRNLDLDLVALKGRTALAGVEIYTAAPQPAITTPVVLRGATATPTFGALRGRSIAGRTWANLRGAFVLGGLLYTGWADTTFTKQMFSGTAVGVSVPVVGADEHLPLNAWKSDVAFATSMFYDSGRIYFTRSDSSALYYRYFTPSTELVGATRHVAASSSSAIRFASFRGAFLSGSKLYWASGDGALRSATWSRSGPVGVPVASTVRVASGTGLDYKQWHARVLFVGP